MRRIVEGETKFSKIGNLAGASDMNGGTDLKAIDLQQLFLAMTEEVRDFPRAHLSRSSYEPRVMPHAMYDGDCR